MDGQWKDLTRNPIKYNVLRNGALVPVERMGYTSEHGAVYVLDKGVYAVSFVGKGDFAHLDQYLDMNMAKTIDDWRAAQVKYNDIPSVNYIVADSKGGIAYFWNAHMPKRVPGWDRTKILPGDISETLWKGWEPVEALPSVIRPKSGYIVNANHSPLLVSGPQDNPKAENYPKDFALDTLVTNRGLRAQELYGSDTSITRDEFFAYKMDDNYSAGSNVMKMKADFRNVDPGADADLKAALDVVAAWNGSADMENRNAALTIFTGQAAMGSQIHGAYKRETALAALKATAAQLKAATGRIDPKWSEVSRVARGDQVLAHRWRPRHAARHVRRRRSDEGQVPLRPRRRRLRRHGRLGARRHLHARHHPPVRLGHAGRVLAPLRRPVADLRREEMEAAAHETRRAAEASRARLSGEQVEADLALSNASQSSSRRPRIRSSAWECQSPRTRQKFWDKPENDPLDCR